MKYHSQCYSANTIFIISQEGKDKWDTEPKWWW